MNTNDRFVDPNIPDELASSIRPKTLADFIGHDALKKNLSVMYELIDVLVNFEERKGFEFSVQYRRLLEVIMKDLASGIVENISS